MDTLLILIPVSLTIGLIALCAFLWAMRSGQFDDLDGAAHRILFDEEDDPPNQKGPPATTASSDSRQREKEA